MTKIQEIMTLDLQEDIKNVIDLEDRSELEIQQEIESYIVTEGIGRHLDIFINQFTSNIKETGVWISGFYGSGKSYFGKMLGYIIDNPTINGTPARERFIPRLKGVSNESLLENSIRRLEAINSRVVFLDVAKQNTDRGLAFTLFSNLLRNLGFRDDLYGYLEFDLFIDEKLETFKNKVKLLEGQDWDLLKTSNRQVARIMRRVFMEMGYSEAEYEDTQKVYSSAIEDFSANKFKTELTKYLKAQPDETLVFVFDEASEAISQKKFSLLDLEGISEALSSISNKVWTLAIAQEKLEMVINNANVNRSQLTKVTDRFKTKVHLEATEVDVIIRSRLLQKTEKGQKELVDYYLKNEGLISDATNLKSTFPTKTTDAEVFATYYPFHRYQLDILQKFLFSSNALVATQIAARGMIITTFDVLRKQMRDKDLFCFVSGHAICTEAQTSPPSDLVNKYDTAGKILKEHNNPIDGIKLLKTIHLLADSGVVSATVENITKSYISDISSYYDIKPAIEVALALLVEAKVLLFPNNNYKITSDLEGKLLEEMRDFNVEFFSKKRALINYIKSNKLFNSVATFNDGQDSFKFSVYSDQEDELTGPGNKQLKLIVYSLFNISENRQDFIEDLKLKTQHQKDQAILIPDTQHFSVIDKLIGEVIRYSYMEGQYSNESDQDKRKIIRDFSIIREERESELRFAIEASYLNASLIYMFDEYLLDVDSFKNTVTDIQRKLVKNIYTKRLASSLSDSLVPRIFSSRKESLHTLFSGEDFRFFDTHGNFIGDHLKVVEEINAKIKKHYVDGRTLESDLSGPPWGFSFGTIVSTLAVLLVAGRLSVKYNGDTWFSHESSDIHVVFTNATKFKSASFKSITATLSAAQKNQAVQLLMDLDIKFHTGRKIDWNTNDFDLADSIGFMADHFLGAIATLRDSIDGFETLFSYVADQKQVLLGFSGKVTENNYIEKVEYLLTNNEMFTSAIQTIQSAQKFIKKNYPKVKEFKRFVEDVSAELNKAGRVDNTIQSACTEFNRLYQQEMINAFGNLQQQVQIVKDNYFKLLKTAAARMSHEYQLLKGKIEAAHKTLQSYPPELNIENQKKLEKLQNYCSDRIVKEPVLEYTVTCKNCGFSLSDMLNYTELVPTKENDLMIIQSNFVKEAPKPVVGTDGDMAPKKPRKILLDVGNQKMSVGMYRKLLTNQLQALAGMGDLDEIELEIAR